MDKKTSLVEVKHNKGLRNIINNVIELLKSKLNKNYILSEKSPDFLRQNKNLILKTVKINPNYLDQVPNNILLEELLQQSIPINGIIDTAFKNGYTLLKNESSAILLGSEAKTAILHYLEIQKDNPHKKLSILEYLDENLLSDINFKNQLLDLAIENGFKITRNSPDYLKQNTTLAQNYYKGLLENGSIDNLLNDNILNSELIKNKDFLQNYVNMLSQKGIDDKTIINTLTSDNQCISILKNDIELFQTLFEQLSPSNLEDFFNKFFSNEELQNIFANQDKLSGKMLQLSQLYAKDNTVLQSLNGKLFSNQYQNIPNYKMQLIAKNPSFQDQILDLNNFEYKLYDKMTQLVSQKTNRWNRFEENIVKNLSDGYYGELINDLYQQAQQGDKITSKDIETLTYIFSTHHKSKSHFNEYFTNVLKNQGKDEKAIKQEETLYSNNVFNITNKKELEHFEEIKELVCDTILTNPSLDDKQLTTPIDKYLVKFKQLSNLDRTKLALLEKYYNMDLSEAANIVNTFSTDIENVSIKDEYQSNIVEQIKAVRNIFTCNNIDTLSQIGNLDVLVQTDLSSSTYLIEQTKEMFEQEYKENLYMPKRESKIGNATFNGKNIEIFNANTDFSMIVKRIGIKNINSGNSKEIWNSMTKSVDEKNELRYYTCCSYMTDENILKMNDDNDIILGFAQGTNNYSFDAIYPHDAHTAFNGSDRIYNDLDSTYMTPSTLETKTDDNYNEVVVNTLGVDKQGQLTKLQPDYVVYIKDKSNTNIQDLENNLTWQKTKKVASEFGIPIIIVDKEKVKESEKTKIANMSEKLHKESSSTEVLKFVKKAEHYTSRYGTDDIIEYTTNDKIKSIIQEQSEKSKEKESISIPNIDISTITRESTTDNKQDILRRQSKLKDENIIHGEDEER